MDYIKHTFSSSCWSGWVQLSECSNKRPCCTTWPSVFEIQIYAPWYSLVSHFKWYVGNCPEVLASIKIYKYQQLGPDLGTCCVDMYTIGLLPTTRWTPQSVRSEHTFNVKALISASILCHIPISPTLSDFILWINLILIDQKKFLWIFLNEW